MGFLDDVAAEDDQAQHCDTEAGDGDPIHPLRGRSKGSEERPEGSRSPGTEQDPNQAIAPARAEDRCNPTGHHTLTGTKVTSHVAQDSSVEGHQLWDEVFPDTRLLGDQIDFLSKGAIGTVGGGLPVRPCSQDDDYLIDIGEEGQTVGHVFKLAQALDMDFCGSRGRAIRAMMKCPAPASSQGRAFFDGHMRRSRGEGRNSIALNCDYLCQSQLLLQY